MHQVFAKVLLSEMRDIATFLFIASRRARHEIERETARQQERGRGMPRISEVGATKRNQNQNRGSSA